MRTSRLVVAALLVGTALAGCKKIPGSDKIPGGGNLPGGGGQSGLVDPNSCGNYAVSEAGRRLKFFLEATQELQKTTTETVEVVKQSCIMIGNEIGMTEADYKGETKDICAAVYGRVDDNLKVSLKAKAAMKVTYKPAECKVSAELSAKASAECEGSASAGTGGSSASGECKASGAVKAAAAIECTPPQVDIKLDAKAVVDKSKAEMTVKGLMAGLPKIFSVKARLKPLEEAVETWAASAAALKDIGIRGLQSFKDQATCVGGQIAAAAGMVGSIRANVSVSVSVSASASASAGVN